MTLNEVKPVLIDPEGGYKFIIVEVIDLVGERKRVVRASESPRYHAEILRDMKLYELKDGLTAICVGGGRIVVAPVAKIIEIWGRSGDFGKEPDRNETVRMLQEAFPDFTVTVGADY